MSDDPRAQDMATRVALADDPHRELELAVLDRAGALAADQQRVGHHLAELADALKLRASALTLNPCVHWESDIDEHGIDHGAVAINDIKAISATAAALRTLAAVLTRSAEDLAYVLHTLWESELGDAIRAADERAGVQWHINDDDDGSNP